MTKTLPIIFAFLFAMMLSVAGLKAGVAPLAQIGSTWVKSRSYVQVPAQVTSAELKVRHFKKGASYNLMASFKYEFEGSQFSSEQVSLHDLPADVTSSLHRLLSQAQRQHAPVQVWLDPKYPASAVLDRDVYAGEVMLHLILGIACFGIGWGAFAGILYTCHPPARMTLGDRIEAGNVIRLRGSLGGVSGLPFTLILNVLFLPFGAYGWQCFFDYNEKAGLLYMIPAFLGLLLLRANCRILMREWRYGKPVLEIRSVAPLRAEIHFHPAVGVRLPVESSYRIVIEAKLVQLKSVSGQGIVRTNLWQESVLDRQVARGTESLSFEVMTPEEGADSQLEIALQLAGTDYTWELPRNVKESLQIN